MSGQHDHEEPTSDAAVPEKAKTELGIGTFLGLAFAEAMSSVRLFGLGERVGFAWYLAWLLPAALDIYAITMVRFFSKLGSKHPLRRKAAREAIIALIITVGCNGLYETILEFSKQLPAWAPGVLFVLVSSLAPFVAGRLIHFRAEVGNGTAASAAPKVVPHAASDALLRDEEVPQETLGAAAPQPPQQSFDAAQDDPPQQQDAAPTEDAAPQQQPEAPQAPAAPQEPAAHIPPPAAASEMPQHDSGETNSVTRLVPKDARPAIAIELIARHGRANVSGTTVGDAIGTSRDTGIRLLRDIDKLPDLAQRVEKVRQRLREAGETVTEDTDAADEPHRELVLA